MRNGKDKPGATTSALRSGLGGAAKGLVSAAGKRLLSNAGEKISAATQRLTDYATNGGGPGLLSAITGGGGGSGGGAKNKSLKVTNIVERIDVGVPVRLAYNQWTQFGDFPSFTKKVESVVQDSDEKVKWRAQILWSHRSWQSTIVEQVPDRRIVWKSTGDKGFVDGAVTFHELAPELTRILLILQYHPKGFFEHTGNLWRAQGRRARLELKHFARHVMTDAVLRQEEIEGWRGEIHDGQVVRSHEDAIKQEQRHQRGAGKAPEQDEFESRQGERATGREPEPSGQRGRSGSHPSTSDDQGDRRRQPTSDDVGDPRRQRPSRRPDDREPGRSSRGRAGSER